MRRCGFRAERGAVMIIEATFVFPIMFIIVFFMILAGEVYFQHARVEQAVVKAAIDGAARIENPTLETVIETGSVPTDTDSEDIMPYRYLFTGNARSVAEQVADDLEKEIEGMGPFFFAGLGPKNVSVSAEPNIYLLFSSLEVECEFEIELPLRMIFSSKNFSFHYTVSVVQSIGDPAELIRNVSTVQDIIERNETASELASKFTEVTEKLARIIN